MTVKRSAAAHPSLAEFETPFQRVFGNARGRDETDSEPAVPSPPRLRDLDMSRLAHLEPAARNTLLTLDELVPLDLRPESLMQSTRFVFLYVGDSVHPQLPKNVWVAEPALTRDDLRFILMELAHQRTGTRPRLLIDLCTGELEEVLYKSAGGSPQAVLSPRLYSGREGLERFLREAGAM